MTKQKARAVEIRALKRQIKHISKRPYLEGDDRYCFYLEEDIRDLQSKRKEVR